MRQQRRNSSLVKGAGSFSDVFPDYQVITKVGTGNVQQGLWERNDFPFDKYFDNRTTVDELNNWRPTGKIRRCPILFRKGGAGGKEEKA